MNPMYQLIDIEHDNEIGLIEGWPQCGGIPADAARHGCEAYCDQRVSPHRTVIFPPPEPRWQTGGCLVCRTLQTAPVGRFAQSSLLLPVSRA